MRSLVLMALLLLALAARAPWLARGATDAERAHAGAARQFVLQRERTPPPLRLDPPAASHLGSVVQWSLRSPAPEWDATGPDDQIGWLTLRDTSLPTGEFVAPWIVAAAMRLPFVLLHLVGLFLVFRLGERFYGTAAGAVATAIVALAAEPCLTGAQALPAALALPAVALLLAALDDFVLAIGYAKSPPPWLLRKRTLALAVACGLALASSFAFLPIVVVAAIWLLDRRRVMERRGDPCRPPSLARRITAVAVAGLIVWALYLGDLGRWEAADLTLPAPLWWQGLVDAVLDAAVVPPGRRLDTLRTLGGPTLLAVGALGLAGWPVLRRDRVDTPSMLAVVGIAAVVTALLAAPRHAPVAVAAALPPFAVLAGAWLTRLARHARVAAAAAVALLLVGIGAGWHERRPWSPPPAEAVAGLPPHASPDESWLLDRWITSRGVPRVVTVLGRKPLLRLTEKTRIEEIPADAERVKAVVAEIDKGADVALIVADWARDAHPLPALSGREPETRFLRLAVYGRR